MKTQLIIILILLMVGYQEVQAQTGIRVGWNYPEIHDISSDRNSGFHAGIYKKIKLLGLLGVEPSIQYSQKGGEIDDMGTNGKERLHYIDVPVLVRLGFLPLINIFAGPQASFLVARKYEGATDISSINELSKFDFGGVVGVGVNLPLGFNVQGSYDFAFSDLNYNNLDSKNRLFKISLGLSF